MYESMLKKNTPRNSLYIFWQQENIVKFYNMLHNLCPPPLPTPTHKMLFIS